MCHILLVRAETILNQNKGVLCQFCCLCDSIYSVLFINSLICSTECCWSSFSFFSPRRSLWLSVKYLSVALPIGSIRPRIPRGLWMAGLLWALSPARGVLEAPPELSARRGWRGGRQGTRGDAPSACQYTLVLHRVSHHAGVGCFLGSFEPFLSYLVCIFWIPWICTLRTWPLPWAPKAGGLSKVCHISPVFFPHGLRLVHPSSYFF